jgi:hypothetical protein
LPYWLPDFQEEADIVYYPVKDYIVEQIFLHQYCQGLKTPICRQQTRSGLPV